MKIAFLSHCSSSLYLFRQPLIDAFYKKGYDVAAFGSDDEYAKLIKHASFTPWSDENSLNPFSNLRDFLKLFSLLKGVDILHTSGHKANCLGILASRFLGIKLCIAQVEGLGNVFIKGGFAKALLMLLYKLCFRVEKAHFFFINKANYKLWQSWGLKPSRAHFIRSIGIDLKRFLPIKRSKEERQSFDKSYKLKNKINIIMVARPLIYKGIRDYIQVAKLLKHKANFFYLGDLPKNPSKYYISKEEFLNSDMIKLGKQSDVAYFLSFCDIFVLPSYAEGFSMSALEAKAAGLALVLSECDGNIELATHASSALFHAINNTNELSLAILQLIDDEALRKSLAKKGLKEVLAFELDFITNKYMIKIQELIKQAFG